jgi:hypothetical protein
MEVHADRAPAATGRPSSSAAAPPTASPPAPAAAAGARATTCLADLGADLLQRVLLRLPDLSAVAAAASFLRDAVQQGGFEADWFLARHERAAPDRQWQYCAAAAWPAARVAGSRGGGRRAAAVAAAAPGAARLAEFLRAVLLRRMELGPLLDPSGPGSTPAEAAAAAARVAQLLREHRDLLREHSARQRQPEGAATAESDGSGLPPEVLEPVVRSLLLLCPHSEHLLLPYLAQGGHAGAVGLVAGWVEPEPAVLKWLAKPGAPAPVHSMHLSGEVGDA